MPLGLLMVGGGLKQAGVSCELLDAEARRLSERQIVNEVERRRPDAVFVGHAGSTPAHPVTMRMLRAIKGRLPSVITVYGGVYPTYHAHEVLRGEACVDVVVRGEGEETGAELGRLIRDGRCTPRELAGVRGISFRNGLGVESTDDRTPTAELDRYPAAWDLIEDWGLYRCFGLGRAAIVQFSRGCPHRCTYCGQHGFWVKWRHRDPQRVADELQLLHDRHGVRFVTLADENPTTSKSLWRAVLEAITARKLDLHFFATIRATDIVRDADMLDLYRKAGILYILLGIDATNPSVIKQVNKRSTMTIDEQACKLLRQHGIRSIVGHIVGLGSETWRDFRTTREVLNQYDGDLLNVMYATPHSWTNFADECADRPVIQEDQSRWDYRHQVLGHLSMSPSRLFLAVKLLELLHHIRPRRMRQLLIHRDALLRRQFRWTAMHIGLVWLGEIAEFVFNRRLAHHPRPLRERFALVRAARERKPAGMVELRIRGKASATPRGDVREVERAAHAVSS